MDEWNRRSVLLMKSKIAIYRILTQRKSNDHHYLANLELKKGKFVLHTGESFSSKVFHHLFKILKNDLTDLEQEYYWGLIQKQEPENAYNGNTWFVNPINGFKVKLNLNDPRTQTWERA